MAKKKNEVAITEEANQEVVDRIVALNKQIDLDLPQEVDELWTFVARLENEAAVNMAKRGMAYILLKEKLGHGNFLKGLEERHTPERHARSTMSVARMLMSLPNSKRQTFAVLADSKLIELARIPTETIEDLSEQGELDIDELDQMSVRELKTHVRKLREGDHRKDLALQKLHSENQRLKVKPTRTHEIHPWVQMMRRESTALTDKAVTCIDDIEELAYQVSLGHSVPNADGSAMIPAVGTDDASTAHVVWLNLQALLSKVQHAITTYKEYNSDPGLTEEDIPLLMPAETRQIMSMREVMLGEHEAEKEARAAVAQSQQKPRRGRPAGKKTATKKKAAKKKAAKKTGNK